MQFTVSQSALSRGLAVVSKGIASQATTPALAGIRIEASEGTVELVTTNLNVSVRHALEASVEEEGVAIVSGRILTNVVKNLPDAAVSLVEDGSTIEISCEKSHFRLNTIDADDFPAFPDVYPDRQIELPSQLLQRMVDKVYRVASKDTSRPILSGILLTVEDNTIRLVATDSYRLAVCDTNSETFGVDDAFQVIVPGAVFHDVLGLPTMTDRLAIGVSEGQIVFRFGSTTYVSRRIEGRFPNFRQLLPDSCTTTVNLDADRLTQALRRVSVIAAANLAVRFDVDAEAGFVRLRAASPDQGEAVETITADVEGATLPIALNYHYVLDCAGSAGSASALTLELNSSMKPAVFKSYGDVNFLYLLMPVRL